MRAAAGETESQENGGGHAGPGVQSGEHLDIRALLNLLHCRGSIIFSSPFFGVIFSSPFWLS